MHIHICTHARTHARVHTQACVEREEVSQLRLAINIFIRFGSAKYFEKIKYL